MAFDALVEPIWLMDAGYRILRCNQAARSLYGDEIIGQHCWEVAHGTQKQIPQCPFPCMKQTRRRESAEIAVGSRWFMATVDPLFSRSGKVAGAIHVMRDITERKLAEKALQEAKTLLEQHVAERTAELLAANRSLRESEERLRLFIRNAPVAIAMFDGKMRYLAASRRWLADYGLEEQNVTGRSHYEIFPEISERWKAFHRRGLAGEIVQADEDAFERKDGTVQWLRWEVQPWFATEDKVGGIVIFTQDITAHRQAEMALRESEEKFRLLFATITDAVLVFDAETRKFLEVNDAALQLYGYTREELQRLTAMDLTAEPHVSDAAIARVADGGATRIPLRYHRKKDGTIFPVEICASTFVLRGRSIYCGIVRDITERQRQETSLREAVEFSQQIINCAQEGIVVYGPDLKYRLMNPFMEKMIGLHTAEVAGRHPAEAFPFLQEAGVIDYLKKVLAGESVSTLEFSFRIPQTGRTGWASDTSAPLCNARGEITGAIGIVHNITERKQTEEALKASEAALKQAQQMAGVGNWEWDVRTGRHTWSEEIYRIYGRDPSLPPAVYPEVKGYFTPESWTRLDAAVEKALVEGTVYECDAEVVRPDGSHRWITACGQAVRDADEKVVRLHGTVQDITERKRSERLLHRANRTLQAIRDCHEAMLRATTERGLLEEICHIIVKTGGERMAWVGFAEKNARKSVRSVASAGLRKDYLENARITWADKPRGHGPVGTAIRTGKVCICNNMLTDPNFAPWREAARRHGYGSAIALPLIVEGQCLGALSIYAAAAEAFDAGEQLLLTDLANDLAFGIGTLRLRAERERLEDEILKSIEREQERIGRDLHDGLCQLLVGAKFRSAYLKKIINGRLPDAEPEAEALEEALNHAIEQTRDLARGLNPVKVAPAGLTAALQNMAAGVRGPHCFCQFPKPVKISDHHVAYHLYRIAQEAVQNALKHAGAKNISITLGRPEKRIVLTVKDDGVGLPRLLKKTGMGLNNMQARARLIGGRLEIRRRKHGGTAVTCELVNPIQTQP